jgi:tryptophanyl-tRNA synthetase
MSSVRFLTGITTSGTPHLGNYVGSIRPSVRASLVPDVESYYFLADYHALIKIDSPERIQRSTLEIAASWLAAGLDPARVTFYRQSDIPEIPELTWFLTCVTGKGVLNRAHAYKAAVDRNLATDQDPDMDVNAGLFMYPILMGADILMFNAHKVPVGRDQIQHIEMARDMAQSFNHRYGEHFIAPQAVIEESVATLPGLDGRKMSKSYDNTIPLFSSRAQLRKLIAGIVTDSRLPGEAKETEGSALFEIYRAFATTAETTALRHAFDSGIAWGDAKQMLFERIDQEISPMRDTYQALMEDPTRIESILRSGALKARSISTPFMAKLRHAVGLRELQTPPTHTPVKTTKLVGPIFKQYRERDGQFYFKLIDSDGALLLQSLAFESPKVAAQCISLLIAQGLDALAQCAGQLTPVIEANRNSIAHALTQLASAKSSA